MHEADKPSESVVGAVVSVHKEKLWEIGSNVSVQLSIDVNQVSAPITAAVEAMSHVICIPFV